jgi:hypothetical protein
LKWCLLEPHRRSYIGFVSITIFVYDRDPVGEGLLAKAVWQAAWIFTGVHIRFFGNGGWRFRPDGDSLFLQAPGVPAQ